jgi:hypothetical protein
MARRFVPVLLAARLAYRLGELDAAVAAGDAAGAEKQVEALRLQWLQSLHVARERSEALVVQIQVHLDAIQQLTAAGAPSGAEARGHFHALDRLLKELAA